MIAYKAHWNRRLKNYRERGILHQSGVQCPQCDQELWVIGPDKYPVKVAYDGATLKEIEQYFAICPNGHMAKL
jgi:hypothetical protein